MATSALIPVQPVFLSKSDKERLAEMEKQRVAFNEQLEARKAALAQYNPLVERYNEQLAKYQEAVAPYNASAAEYNRQLAQRQAAVDEYNRQLLARQTAESEYNKMVEGYEKERLSYNEMISPYNRAVEEYNKQLEAYKSSFLPGAKEGEIALLQRIDGNLYDAQGNPLPADTPYSSYAGLPENVFARRTSANYPSLPTVPAAYSGPAAPVAPVYKGPEVPVYGGPAEPTKPVYTGPAEPIKPVYTGPEEPVAPFTQESFEQFQQEAQGRAQQAAGQRALAAEVYQDPSKFGLAGFAGLSARAFAKGGEVKDGEPRTKAGRMMKELGFSKAPKEKTLADEPSRQSPETLAYSLRAQSEANKDADLRRKTLAAPGALEVKRFKEGGESRKSREETPEERLEDRRASDIEFIGGSRRLPGLPEPMDIRSDMLGFIKRMDDASLMATASKMTGMPFSSPTQARVMLEKMLGDDAAISAGLIGMGRNLPERVVGYSVGARMPAFGGQLNVGADIPRGPGSPMFNLGYTKQFQAGGAVSKRNRPVKASPFQPAQGTQLDSANTFGSEDAFEFTPAGTRNRMTRFIKSSAGDASGSSAKLFADPQITRSRDEFDRLARASKQEPLPSDMAGMFDAFVGPRGAIFVSPLGGPATFTHEMAHAADYNMGKLYRQASAAKEQKSNPAAQQFAEAYEKLVGKSPAQEKRAEGARALATEWFDELEKQKAYRNYPPELTAFAMENAIGGDRGQLTPQRAPLHVDPTLATEFTLLTDLAQKYVDSRTNKPR